MADLKSQRELQTAFGGDDFLNSFLTVEQLCSRWRISDRTARHLEESGQLKSFVLPGKAHRKFYRVTDIAKMESELRDPPADADQADSVDEQRVQAAIAKLQALVGRAEAITAPAAPTPKAPDQVGDARRRKAVFDAFDATVSADDRYRPLLEKNLTAKLDSDAKLTAEHVESFIDRQRADFNAVVNLLATERQQAAMASLFPTAAERDAAAEKVTPVELPRHVAWIDPLVEQPAADDPSDAVKVETFEGFGLGRQNGQK